MIKKDMELFFKPIEVFDCISDENKSEMSKGQLAFLCGLIKAYRPQKIVEIGVAAGGTTAVVLNCLSMINLDAQMISIDLSSEYYRDKSKKTGYLIDAYKNRANTEVKHTLYTGKVAVERLEEIGKDIDFLILDTVHSLPGELLDFLACYPLLKKGSIVVLHDIALNHYGSSIQRFATKLLFDTIAADKYLEIPDDNVFPNIGAFMINDDTDKYIGNIFSALTITWNYMPSEQELFLYRNFYEKYYTNDNLRLFDIAVQLNKKTLAKKAQEKNELSEALFCEAFRWNKIIRNKKVYIYGCGHYGKKLQCLLEQAEEIELAGYIVSDDQEKAETDEKVYYLSEVNLEKDRDIILVGVRLPLQDEICVGLRKKGFTDYIIPSEKFFRAI